MVKERKKKVVERYREGSWKEKEKEWWESDKGKKEGGVEWREEKWRKERKWCVVLVMGEWEVVEEMRGEVVEEYGVKEEERELYECLKSEKEDWREVEEDEEGSGVYNGLWEEWRWWKRDEEEWWKRMVRESGNDSKGEWLECDKGKEEHRRE